MVYDHPDEYESQWAANRSIASKLGCSAETLRKWLRQSEISQDKRDGLASSEQARLKELERKNRELKRSNEILRKPILSSPKGRLLFSPRWSSTTHGAQAPFCNADTIEPFDNSTATAIGEPKRWIKV